MWCSSARESTVHRDDASSAAKRGDVKSSIIQVADVHVGVRIRALGLHAPPTSLAERGHCGRLRTLALAARRPIGLGPVRVLVVTGRVVGVHGVVDWWPVALVIVEVAELVCARRGRKKGGGLGQRRCQRRRAGRAAAA